MKYISVSVLGLIFAVVLNFYNTSKDIELSNLNETKFEPDDSIYNNAVQVLETLDSLKITKYKEIEDGMDSSYRVIRNLSSKINRTNNTLLQLKSENVILKDKLLSIYQEDSSYKVFLDSLKIKL